MTRTTKNLYPGVNPHLNSFLQTDDGGWESFHAELIIQIRRFLDAHLPAGYLAIAEKSLQVSEVTSPGLTTSRTRPDVTVYQSPVRTGASAIDTATIPTEVLPLLQALEEEEFLTGVIIYQVGEGSPYGKPITRIEVLSPANKPGGTYYPRYRIKRIETLHGSLRLVEVDLLHETRPVIPTLASYPDHEPGAYPYYIIVSDPRPTFEQGQIFVYGTGVADPLPTVNIPLAGVDHVILNCNEVYHQVYESLRLVQVVVDYEVEPVNFHRYSENDRKFIQEHMAKIRT